MATVSTSSEKETELPSSSSIIELFHPFLLDNELRRITIKMNPSFRHFLSITLVISRLRSDGLRWRMTDGGMNSEERDGRLGRPQWLSIREQLFIAREHRSWTSTSCSGVHILVTPTATDVHPSSVTIIRYHVSYCLSATFTTVTDATDFLVSTEIPYLHPCFRLLFCRHESSCRRFPTYQNALTAR